MQPGPLNYLATLHHHPQHSTHKHEPTASTGFFDQLRTNNVDMTPPGSPLDAGRESLPFPDRVPSRVTSIRLTSDSLSVSLPSPLRVCTCDTCMHQSPTPTAHRSCTSTLARFMSPASRIFFCAFNSAAQADRQTSLLTLCVVTTCSTVLFTKVRTRDLKPLGFSSPNVPIF